MQINILLIITCIVYIPNMIYHLRKNYCGYVLLLEYSYNYITDIFQIIY
jgi:hypothetical protein